MIRAFHVRGVTCGHCVQILERSLGRIPGVRRAHVDGPAGHIDLDYNPYRVSDTMLTAAIRDAGFHPLATRERQPLEAGFPSGT